jgi:hypothetical protein
MAQMAPTLLPTPANSDEASFDDISTDHRILAWLFRRSEKQAKQSLTPSDADYLDRGRRFLIERTREPNDDWQTVSSLCGYAREDFADLDQGLPLTAAEIDHFRRNHRGADHLVGRDFLTAKSDLPSPLAELYGLYRHRARMDAEAALFVAQATNATRIACTMADLLAIGAFAQGNECIAHMMTTYAVPAAFDTSDLIDHANREAQRRLSLPADHPAHLLKLSPDEINVLATNIVEKNMLSSADFMEKATLLAEARQDVNRLPAAQQFVTAIRERDLPLNLPWVARLCVAYSRVFQGWIVNTPELSTLIDRQPAAS